jgi:nondiscriminating glutamyl-tRNA synthetase
METVTKPVRVRFAPSPTGYVHVGSLRTALYNFLFARKNGGKLVLRIEDTDRARLVDGAVENLLHTMKWAGIEFDEGPEQGGDLGPYYQSERLDIYHRHIETLLENGHAYHCFCSAERLEKLREQQAESGEDPKYDGHCRSIPAAEASKRAATETHVIRMRVPGEGDTIVEDIVRGTVSFQNTLIDDQVLIKSDRYPTYHFANVVDDYSMGITHVIRGEEWLPSTPKHVLLYQFFGWPVPQFAHLPLLLNPDRSKLSKRQGDVAVEDYRAKGYLPQALVNFVALLGWSKGDDQELFRMDELIADFSLERVNKAGAVFNHDKLNWMNGHYLRSISAEDYTALALQKLTELELSSGNADTDAKIVQAVRATLATLNDLRTATALFFNDEISEYSSDAAEWLRQPASKELFRVMRNEVAQSEKIDLEEFKRVMKNVQTATGIKGKDLWMPVRAAMTGMTEGPELPVVIDILGKERILAFLDQAINL